MNKPLLVLLLLCSANAFGALNKWVDANGKVHYSDEQPPANVKAQTLRSDSSGAANSAASAPAAPKSIAEREADWKKSQKAKQEASEKSAQEKAINDEKKANCAAAQQNLRTLQQGSRMVEVGADGERAYLDDAQRQQRIAKTQQDISKLCN